MTGLALLALGACGERELILDGERFDIRAPLPGSDAAAAAPAVAPDTARAFAAPAPRNYDRWTHRGGDVTRNVEHPALAASLSPLFSVDIGQGNTRRARLTADPVVAENRIFTLDSASRVTALGTNGQVQWARSLVPASDKDRDASGGGVAFGENTIFAATGFGELFALDPATGATRWRQKLEAPVTSSPTVSDGKVYVITRDSRAWALGAAGGRLDFHDLGSR